jgi:hypothetical protein
MVVTGFDTYHDVNGLYVLNETALCYNRPVYECVNCAENFKLQYFASRTNAKSNNTAINGVSQGEYSLLNEDLKDVSIEYDWWNGGIYGGPYDILEQQMYTWRLTTDDCGTTVESITENAWALGQCDRFGFGCDVNVRFAAYPSGHDGQWFTYHRNSVGSDCTKFDDPAYKHYIDAYFNGALANCNASTSLCTSYEDEIPQLVLRGTAGWWYENIGDPVMGPTVLNDASTSDDSDNDEVENQKCGWDTLKQSNYRFTVKPYDQVSVCTNDETNALSQACLYTSTNGEAYCGKGSWYYGDTCHHYFCQVPLSIDYGSYQDTSCQNIPLDDSNGFYLLESGLGCGNVACNSGYSTSDTAFVCSKGSLTSEPLCGANCNPIGSYPVGAEGISCTLSTALNSVTNPTCT